MKTRRLLIIALIIALLVVYGLIGTGYLKQRNQQESLAAQVAEVNQALALVPQPPADLDTRLAAAQDSLEAARGTFAIDTNDTRIINRILQLAEASGVKAIPLATQPWTAETVSGQDYAVFRIDIEAIGDYAQLAGFLNRLENGEPGTMIIEYLNIERIPGVSLLESDAASALPINAHIKIAVYANYQVSK